MGELDGISYIKHLFWKNNTSKKAKKVVQSMQKHYKTLKEEK